MAASSESAAVDKTFRVLTSAVEACTIADDVAGAERWMAALHVGRRCHFASTPRRGLDCEVDLSFVQSFHDPLSVCVASRQPPTMRTRRSFSHTLA